MAITVGRKAIPTRSLLNNTKSPNWTAVYSQNSKLISWVSPAQADRLTMNWSSNNIVKTLAALKTSQHRLQQPRPPSIPSLSDGPYTATIPQPNVLSITATLKVLKQSSLWVASYLNIKKKTRGLTMSICHITSLSLLSKKPVFFVCISSPINGRATKNRQIYTVTDSKSGLKLFS